MSIVEPDINSSTTIDEGESNAGCGIILIPKKGTKSDVWLEQKDGTVMN